MNYSSTKTYTLDAASTAMADIVAALITHWTSAPGLWDIVDSVAGESVSVVAKASPTCHLNIRRVSTTQLSCNVDPDSNISDPGDASTSPTGSANMSPDCHTGTISSISTRFFVCEYEDAITVLFQDSTKTYTNYGIHAGNIYQAYRASDQAIGFDGHGAMVGHINNSGTNSWASSSSQVNGSRVRTYNNGGVASWRQCSSSDFGSVLSTSGNFGGISPDGTYKRVVPLTVTALDTNASYDCKCGEFKYLGAAPIGGSPVFSNAAARSIIQSPVDQAWAYLKNTTGTSGLVVSWERGVSFT